VPTEEEEEEEEEEEDYSSNCLVHQFHGQGQKIPNCHRQQCQ
jgi:hypothetical protein